MTGHAAWATWQPRHGGRALSVDRITEDGIDGEPVAVMPLAGVGRPGGGELDDALQVLGYTRLGPWHDTASGLVADVEPIRPH